MLGISDPISFIILSFWSLFAIVDPVGAIPTFLSVTAKDTVKERVRMARIATIVAFFILALFSVGGRWILDAFGVSMPAFQIAGGVVLFKVALDMLQARQTALKETPEEQAEAKDKDDVAVTPLAVPMLAGPGAITAVVLLSTQATNTLYHAIVTFNIFLVSLITFIILRFAATRASLLSGITLKIVARLMGLLLAAIAVQFVLNGIRDVQKIW